MNRGLAPLLIVLVVAIVASGTYIVYDAVKKTDTTREGTESGFRNILENIKNATEQKILISSPTPSPTGSLKARVVAGYYSKELQGASVKITGQFATKTATTDSQGYFNFPDLPVGKYKISITHSDYNFSEYDYDITEGNNQPIYSFNGFLKNPKPLNVNGQNFSDKNGDNQKNGNDTGLKIFLTLYNKIGDTNWALNKHVETDNDGNFSFQVSDTGTYKLEPNHITFYNKPGPVEFIVDGYGGTKTYFFPYYPVQSQSTIRIYVFNDKNENGNQDGGEEYIHYQAARITNTSNGNTWKVAVPPDGDQESVLDYGSYTVKLEPDDSSWDYYYKITRGDGSFNVTNTSGDQTITLGAHKLY